MQHDQSDAWWDRAQQVIPLGTQTLSKSPTQWVQGVAPKFIERAEGAHLWDVDGNEWIDWPMSLGPILLGHGDPRVDQAIIDQLADGITFTLMHPLEVEVAERIIAACPGVEAVRFAKSGSDAVSAAVRVARAVTGRDVVLCSGYHGWHDWYIGTTTRDLGVPKAVQDLSATFRDGDLDHLDQVLSASPGAVAAVVLEPSGATVPDAGYLQGVIDLAHEHGALCVFDEVITGFRLALGGARERYDVEPDISCYGKALGNGMPISAIGGRWAHMRILEEVFFSGTHGGETLSLAAAAAVLDVLTTTDTLAEIERMGDRMLDGIGALIARHGVEDRVTVGGEPQRAVLGFNGPEPLVDKTWTQQVMLDHRCLFNGGMFISAAHTDADVDAALAGFDEAFTMIATGKDLRPELRGPVLEPVFRAPVTTDVLVLGAGSIGSRHARNLVAAGAKVAVADPMADRAGTIEGATTVPYDLDRAADFDAVVVASPTSEHRDQALAIAGQQVPTLVEKPLAVTSAGLDVLRPFAQHIDVGFNLRFHEPVRQLAEIVRSGGVGNPVSGRFWFGSWLPDWRPQVDYRTTYSARSELGGGVLLDVIHELDLLVWIFGNEIDVVGAVVDRVGPLDIDVEDTVKALVRTAAGVPIELSLDYLSRRYRRGIEIIGDEATVRLDWARQVLEIEHADDIEVRPADTPVDRSYEDEAEHFLAFARGDAAPSVDLESALASLDLADRIRAAAK